ncbi:zinc finger CCCH domain-containing protein 44-like isoform X1 [Hibiscus syriacus]|uniref:zinc finger CCCH domain-containing protein 44-like isoform X1 n=1 Tax=Hibiscus syriacus TaxID=106335 RepID=UPI001920E750|nr:zinc finger CCCH domain-containing protein 44-like isoform X1 [Hibiscus syriacus]
MACAGVGKNNDCLNRDCLRGEELTRSDQCQRSPDMIVGKADVAANGVKVVEMTAGKRRRGRPPRNQGKVDSSSAAPPQRENQDGEEEDVCFICFDGGSLVLCDRRGCPKAYHPACIKRDEAFFKSKAKWNCGWHICSTCHKSSYYMCYTCTYSLCKNCTKDAADYVNVRGNKGFCGLCMKTIMMIESTAFGTNEMVQVDFDDQTSWEYLFKMYWVLLKEKLSLSLCELIKAKNLLKDIAKGVGTERPFGDLGASYSKRRKTIKQQTYLNKAEPLEAEKSGVMIGMPLPEGTDCASDKGLTKGYPLFLNMKEKEPPSPLKRGDVLSDIGSETEKIWHYQDPLGKIHGPFPMAMLRRWSMSGLFPPDLRVWRASERKEDSTLLTDALAGRYSQPQQLFHKSCIPVYDARFSPNDGYQNKVGDVRGSWDLNVDQIESKQVEVSSNSMQNDASGPCCGNNESAKSKELGSRSSSCTTAIDIVTSNAVQTGSPLTQWESGKGDNYFPGQPRVSSSLPSSTFSGKSCETQSHLDITGHGVEKWDCGSINMNENSNKTSNGQFIAGNVKQNDTEGQSGKSCGQSWRSPLNNASNGWDANCGLISLARALEAAEHNHDIDFVDLPTSTSKMNLKDSKPQGTKNKQSLSASALHQDSGPSWSSASSLVVNGPLLSEVASEWGGYSSTPAKPSPEEWDSDLVLQSSLKRTSLGNDHAATPSSGSGQFAHSCLSDPAENASAWDPIIPNPNEYSFGDESVSDLLAEVEAMESLNALTSSTSILRWDGELAQGAEPYCFSPAPDPGKSDALSSTNDLRMSSESTLTIETIGVSKSEVLDGQKSYGRHSSTSAEMDEDKWPNNVSVNQYEAGSGMQFHAPGVTWGMASIDTTWKTGRETTATNSEAIQRNHIFNLGGLDHGARNFSWGRTSPGTFPGNGSINLGTYWGNQQEGLDFPGRDSSFIRGRSSMHRHSTYDVPPNGVGSFRPPPKGQRVCKLYERGECNKGASCSYWHPR